MVLSFSRPDPSSPTAVAGASFSVSRRGFDQAEVKDFLRMVSAEMSRLHERVLFLERELRESRHTSPLVTSELTEEAIIELLGEETARIVEAAREAAHKMKVRSEESAARIVKEATDEAARIREETEIECARRRQDATSDADAEVLMAKQQGREMVNEARAYRERVLADVTRRREMAREQLESLSHGRERLVHVFERARSATDDVLRDLLEPTDTPTAFVNLAPTTGPVPVIVQAEDIVSIEAVRPPSSAPEYDTDESVEVAIGHVEKPSVSAPVDGDEVTSDDDGTGTETFAERNEAQLVETDEAQFVETELAEPTSIHSRSFEAHPSHSVEQNESPLSNVVQLFARSEGREDPPAPVSVPPKKTDADDIFARLRRSNTEQIAHDVERKAARRPSRTPDGSSHVEAESTETAPESPRAESTPRPRTVRPPVADGDNECFQKRNEAVIPIIVAMSRMIKRVLADEQNQVLDILRGKPIVRQLDALVGSRVEHGGRYVAAVRNLVNEAALAGAKTLSNESESTLVRKIEVHIGDIDEFITSTLVDALRDRLSRAMSQSSESNAELAALVRVVYREWKNQYVDEHMDDVALMAFGRGAASVLRSDMRVCWRVDPDGPPCADAEDNSLAGYVRGGEEFPTGHTHAPAHAGCRCVLVGEPN